MTPIVKLGQGSFERLVMPAQTFKSFDRLRRCWCAGWPIVRGALCSIMGVWLLVVMARAVELVIY